MKTVWKIMGAEDWAQARACGLVAPAPVDRRDGYIHLSGEDQVLETARLHFSGRADLVAACFDAGDFGDALKWEASRGGALFPHLYGDLPADKARRVVRLAPLGNGAFGFGEAAP